MLLIVVVPPEGCAATALIEAVPPCALYACVNVTLSPATKFAELVPLDWHANVEIVGRTRTITGTETVSGTVAPLLTIRLYASWVADVGFAGMAIASVPAASIVPTAVPLPSLTTAPAAPAPALNVNVPVW